MDNHKKIFLEILEELKITIDNYKKSNDEKYLTQIKNVTGNSLSDDNLAQLSSKGKESFLKEMNELFFKKSTWSVSDL